jgi:hypothetical protein
MPTPHSIDGKLLAGFELRGMPVSEFAVVARAEGIRGASKTVLNEAFRDVKALPNETASQLWALWQEIEELCQRSAPFVLDLSDGKRAHDWLVAYRALKQAASYDADSVRELLKPDGTDSI